MDQDKEVCRSKLAEPYPPIALGRGDLGPALQVVKTQETWSLEDGELFPIAVEGKRSYLSPLPGQFTHRSPAEYVNDQQGGSRPEGETALITLAIIRPEDRGCQLLAPG